jgi:hypothetical protein
MEDTISPSRLNLRAGEWVEVRSKQAILSTLDEQGRLEELPFMPEMFAFCGKRYRVWKRAHKTCDTVNNTGGRRMNAAVHLEEVRCNGDAHGGCEAQCLIFWKEAWLERVDGPEGPPLRREPSRDHREVFPGPGANDDGVWAAARVPSDSHDADVIYACQATLLPRATTPLPWWDVRQYCEDYTSGNTSLWQLASGATYVCYYSLVGRVARSSRRGSAILMRLYDRWQTMVRGTPYPRRWGTISPGEKTPSRPLHLKAGDLVQVRTYRDILATLDRNNRNRGMYFDAEEVPYCGNSYRVRSTVNKIIDERTGKMLMLKDHNVILEGVFCQARYSDRRMFCPRAIYSYWRETWLIPVDANPEEVQVERRADDSRA